MFSHFGGQYRATVSDLRNGLSARDAKRAGIKLVRNGMLRRYYSATGELLFAYSYDACIYALVYDAQEGFYRDVFNLTNYSHTTNGHLREIASELQLYGIVGEQWRWSGEAPRSLRERRAMTFLNAPRNYDHVTMHDHVMDFINRYPSRAREYMARNSIAV